MSKGSLQKSEVHFSEILPCPSVNEAMTRSLPVSQQGISRKPSRSGPTILSHTIQKLTVKLLRTHGTEWTHYRAGNIRFPQKQRLFVTSTDQAALDCIICFLLAGAAMFVQQNSYYNTFNMAKRKYKKRKRTTLGYRTVYEGTTDFYRSSPFSLRCFRFFYNAHHLHHRVCKLRVLFVNAVRALVL